MVIAGVNLVMAPASLTDFHWLFSVPSRRYCSGTSDRPWPHPSTSIPVQYAPAIIWWWIPILTQLNDYSLLILCTMYCDIGRLKSGKFWLQAVHQSSGDCSVCHVQMTNVYCAGWWSCAVGTLLLNSKLDRDCLQSFVTKADQNMAHLNLLLEYVASDNEAANLLPKWVWHVICRTRSWIHAK